MAPDGFRARYEYPARTRHIPLVVLGVWLGAGAIFIYAMTPSDHTPPMAELLALLIPFAALTGIALLGQWFYNRNFRPIDLTNEGIWFGGVERSTRFIGWDQIDRASRVINPDRKSAAPGRYGLVIWVGGRARIIHEQIERFDELMSTVEKHLSERGIMIGRL